MKIQARGIDNSCILGRGRKNRNAGMEQYPQSEWNGSYLCKCGIPGVEEAEAALTLLKYHKKM